MTDDQATIDRPQRPSVVGDAPTGALWIGATLLPVRLFLIAGWARAGIAKVIDTGWWRGDGVREFVVSHRDLAVPVVRPLTDHVVVPHAAVVAVLVVVAQLTIAAGIATGRHLRWSLGVGVAMNVTFVLHGAVNPSAFYIAMQLVLLAPTGQRRHGPASTRWTVPAVVALLAAAAALVPFVRTLHPARVIDDPALMLAFLCLVGAATPFARLLDGALASGRETRRLGIDPWRVAEWIGMDTGAARQSTPVEDAVPGSAAPMLTSAPRRAAAGAPVRAGALGPAGVPMPPARRTPAPEAGRPLTPAWNAPATTRAGVPAWGAPVGTPALALARAPVPGRPEAVVDATRPDPAAPDPARSGAAGRRGAGGGTQGRAPMR